MRAALQSSFEEQSNRADSNSRGRATELNNYWHWRLYIKIQTGRRDDGDWLKVEETQDVKAALQCFQCQYPEASRPCVVKQKICICLLLTILTMAKSKHQARKSEWTGQMVSPSHRNCLCLTSTPAETPPNQGRPSALGRIRSSMLVAA